MALFNEVQALCSQMADQGWRNLLLAVTNGGLDLSSPDLADQLLQRLTINSDIAGFEDFSFIGTRGIEPGSPARSLLYHAFASPGVLSTGQFPLEAFPTLPQIEAVENYVYGVEPPTLESLNPDGLAMGIVVFALEYRNGARVPHRRHADLCLSRTGIARAGTLPPNWWGAGRQWATVDPALPYDFAVRPVRYAAFLAVGRMGNPDALFPAPVQPGDDQRCFWEPVHKLFNGTECLVGYDLQLSWSGGHVNEKLRRTHLTLLGAGYPTNQGTNWGPPDLGNAPFRFTDGIATVAADTDTSGCYVTPQPHDCLVEAATYNDEPLVMFVPSQLRPATGSSDMLSRYFSGLEIHPVGPYPMSGLSPANRPMTLVPQGRAHPGPEIINVRHRIDNGVATNLNTLPGVQDIVQQGAYYAQHFVDFTGDGWVSVSIPQLADAVPVNVSAYSAVCAPDFFPYCNQAELVEMAARDVPANQLEGLWAVVPRSLSDTRKAANQTLGGANFVGPMAVGTADTTVTAIVNPPEPQLQPASWPNPGVFQGTLPDDASGVFDPGWDLTTDAATPDDAALYLTAYGLGTPFVEDVKICAALATYWPAEAPDAARTFQPDHYWPTVSPLTDIEIGSVGDLPWDGVTGPRLVDATTVEYTDIDYADYVDAALAKKFSARWTSLVDSNEYMNRVRAMAWVYDTLGVAIEPPPSPPATVPGLFQRMQDYLKAKAEWTVLGFQVVTPDDANAAAAAAAAGYSYQASSVYAFGLFRRGQDLPGPSFDKRHVTIISRVWCYTDLRAVLTSSDEHTWNLRRLPD